MKAAGRAAFVLVAGGLGERLGYSGIKLALPVDSASNKCFLQVGMPYTLSRCSPDQHLLCFCAVHCVSSQASSVCGVFLCDVQRQVPRDMVNCTPAITGSQTGCIQIVSCPWRQYGSKMYL